LQALTGNVAQRGAVQGVGASPGGGAQPIGVLGSSLQGPISMTRQMGEHADWGKFERTARPSTNIEDNRNRPKSLKERYGNAMDSAADQVTGALFK
jgi:hypothetical protein